MVLLLTRIANSANVDWEIELDISVGLDPLKNGSGDGLLALEALKWRAFIVGREEDQLRKVQSKIDAFWECVNVHIIGDYFHRRDELLSVRFLNLKEHIRRQVHL